MIKISGPRLLEGSAHGVLAVGLVLGVASPAFAQDSVDPQTEAIDRQAAGGVANVSSQDVDGEIVVTGTLIRGAAPVGSNIISVGQEKLESTGAATSNELLATIPQVTNYFNRVPGADLAIAVNQIQISRPNIRNLALPNAASSPTLVMFDGHRIASGGVRQASVDPDIIPPGAIERVEVVTEGGSSTYGADAVAGVINFITRRRFDGLEANARYGFADNYWQVDAGMTAGKDWGSGSAYVSYSFVKNDALYGRDRDFIRGVDYSSQPYVPLGRACDLPNLQTATTFNGFLVPGSTVNFAYPGLVPNTFNTCDSTDDDTFLPASERHGVLASLSQNLDDTTTIDVKAFWGRRETESFGTARSTVSLTQPGAGLMQQRSVAFSYAPLLGRNTVPSGTLIEEWGVNAEIRKELAGDWQVRGLFNFSRSNSEFFASGPNAARLGAAARAGAFDPANIAAANPALIDDILDNEIAGQAKDELLDLRAIVDGTLLTLPGGEVRMALGYEYMHDGFQQRYESDIRRGTLRSYPFGRYNRRVHSVFGELRVPLFGDDNATAGIRSFVISASGRYDHYSDFGSTFNPKIGATYKPTDWIALRGNWGTSFTAPTPLDQLGSSRNSLDSFPFAAFVRPGDVLPGPITCCISLALQGSREGLKPQTAETWSLGFDLDPPFVPGLRASVSYYNVKFEDILATPTPNAAIFTEFPGLVTSSVSGLTRAQLDALRGIAPNANTTIDALPAGRPVYQFVDFRTGNFGILKVSGVDFNVNYRHETGFGSLDFSVNGNYELTRKQQASPDAPVVDLQGFETGAAAGGGFSLQSTAGAQIGQLRAQVTWNHSGAFKLRAPTTSTPVQRKVGAFNTINLFFKYDVPGDSPLLRDLSFTLNVNNVFDQDPPILRRNNFQENGYGNGFTLGRMFILGASKKF